LFINTENNLYFYASFLSNEEIIPHKYVHVELNGTDRTTKYKAIKENVR